MSQPLLIDQHTGSATYIETMRDDHFFVIRWGRLRTTARLSWAPIVRRRTCARRRISFPPAIIRDARALRSGTPGRTADGLWGPARCAPNTASLGGACAAPAAQAQKIIIRVIKQRHAKSALPTHPKHLWLLQWGGRPRVPRPVWPDCQGRSPPRRGEDNRGAAECALNDGGRRPALHA